MASIFAEKRPETSSRAIANQTTGDTGKSMPAIPTLQKKGGLDEEEKPAMMKAAQLKEDTVQKAAAEEDELPAQAKFIVQKKGGPEEEEPLQMKPFQLKSDTVQKAGLPEEEPLQKKPFQLKSDTVQKAGLPEEEPLQKKPIQLKSDTVQKAALPEEEPLQKKSIQLKSNTVQKAAAPEEELPVQGKLQPVQKKENKTGLPDNLKSGVEQLSGHNMDDVKVHYNSSQPSQLNALAYAQGTDIHVGPGQERHLPHEAWHVAQQKQGRVQPTMQMKAGVAVNDDPGLESEADTMGAKAIQMKPFDNIIQQYSDVSKSALQMKIGTVQRYIEIETFFPLIKGLDNNIKHRLMYWNSGNIFDDVKDDVPALKAKINDFKGISESAGGAELAPGQTDKNERMPGYLNYFSNFSTNLPAGMGVLNFKKSFDRLTDHGWISDNAVLPKAKFNNKEVTAHVILAVKDVEATSESVVINPHVTVRVKDAQDMFDQIALISDKKVKGKEMKKLGLYGSQNSLSIGISSDREKENTNAQANVGIEMPALKAIFTEGWLVGVVNDAQNAAKADASVTKTKTFITKGATADIAPDGSSSSGSTATSPSEMASPPVPEVSDAHL